MTADQKPSGPAGPGLFGEVIAETIAALRRLPDLRAALEALVLFLLVLGMGAWAASQGVLVLKHTPISSNELIVVWLSAFLIPSLSEEVIFRGWVRRGAPIAAIGSLLAYILWHPVQTWFGLPYSRPEFLDPRFLGLIAAVGTACTISRLRSGSIWPAVVIHWGAVVMWISLYRT